MIDIAEIVNVVRARGGRVTGETVGLQDCHGLRFVAVGQGSCGLACKTEIRRTGPVSAKRSLRAASKEQWQTRNIN